MSTAAEFQIYADEAMRWARLANNERDQHALMKLACTWAEAAAMSQNPMLVGHQLHFDGPQTAR
jgi:hypothetical protein